MSVAALRLAETRRVTITGRAATAMTIEVMLRREARRRWDDESKARILSEAMAPGAVVAEVARRHGVASSLIFTWRSRMARQASGPRFLPVHITADTTPGGAPPAGAAPAGAAQRFEVVLRGGRVLRLPLDIHPGRAAALARALET
jgi:transposase